MFPSRTKARTLRRLCSKTKQLPCVRVVLFYLGAPARTRPRIADTLLQVFVEYTRILGRPLTVFRQAQDIFRGFESGRNVHRHIIRAHKIHKDLIL